MRKARMKRIALGVLATGMLSISAFATSFGSSSTMPVKAGGGWQSNYSIKDKKAYSNVDTGIIKVLEKTMVTTPQGKIVNSGGKTRSTTKDLKGKGQYYVALGSECQAGYTYYLSVKPSSLQSGKDYITAQINVG